MWDWTRAKSRWREFVGGGLLVGFGIADKIVSWFERLVSWASGGVVEDATKSLKNVSFAWAALTNDSVQVVLTLAGLGLLVYGVCPRYLRTAPGGASKSEKTNDSALPIDCPYCDGTARAFVTDKIFQPCAVCDGTGSLSGIYRSWPRCRYCSGTGKGFVTAKYFKRCPKCSGIGRISPR